MKILREPLLHFLAIGGAVFLLHRLVSPEAPVSPSAIVVTRGEIESMAAAFTRARLRPPTVQEIDELVRDRVREEVYCREAIALGLDRDDTIVRRRLRQKMEFVLQDIATARDPTDAELEAYLQAHGADFRREATCSFSHVYFNTDVRGDHLQRDLSDALVRLGSASPPDEPASLGDAFLLEFRFSGVSRAEIVKVFGEGFADSLRDLPVGRWSGPVKSGFGTHLVLLERFTPAETPPLAGVRDAVRIAWEEERRREANERLFQELLARYSVTIESVSGPDTGAKGQVP